MRLLTDAVLRVLPGLFCVFDGEERLTRWNLNLERTLGYGPEELRRMKAAALFPAEEAPKVRERIAEAFRTGYGELDTRVATKSGRTVPVRLTCFRVESEGNAYLVCVGQDPVDKQQIAETLQRERDQFLSIFDSLDAGIYVSDLETHRILYANPHLMARFGEDMVGRLCYEVLQGFDAPCRFCTNPIILARKPASYQWEHLNPKSGRYADLVDRIIRWPDGREVRLEIGVDITDRKLAEEALRDANRVIEHSPVVLFRWKAEAGWPVAFVSKNVTQFGYAPEDLLSGAIPFVHLIHPDDRERVAEEVGRHIREGRSSYRQEYRFLDKGGGIHWVDDRTTVIRDPDGRIETFEGTLLDITDRKLAEEALADRLRYEEGLSACSRALVHREEGSIDRALGHLRDAARVSRVCLFLNYEDPQEGLSARLAHEILAPGIQSPGKEPSDRRLPYRRGFQRWIANLSSGRPVEGIVDGFPKEERGLLLDRGILSILVLPIHASGSWMGFIAFEDIKEPRLWSGRDVHLLQTAAEILGYAMEQTRVEEHLRQSRKIEAVGRLAAGIAHDFNNMLTPILGFADFLSADLGPGDRNASTVEEIRKAALQSRDLVQQLLSFSRRQVLDLKAMDLRRVAADMEPMLRRTLRENIGIRIDSYAQPCMARADLQLLHQVLLNLALNAQDAMPEGGLLTVEVAPTTLDVAYCAAHADVEPGDYVMLAVTDTGRGMDEEVREHAFEPFYTTKGQGKGTGLGLATVYGIVKQLGGSIWLYSERGHGTTLRIYLPAVTEAPAGGPRETDPAGGAASRSGAVGGTETIMLVEDNEMVRRLTESLLRRVGYDVRVASSAAECLEKLSRHEGPLDLLLTDVIMPRMNGKDLYGRAAVLHPGLKVLYMSGYTADVITHQGILEEGVNLIQKPFTVKALTDKVRGVLDSG